MRLFVLMMMLAGLGFADVTPTAGSGETAIYFEPTQADKDCCASAILAQQENYRLAVSQKNYRMARASALFHFTKAWVWFNEAMSIAQTEEGWMNVSELKKAQDMLINAGSAIAEAEKAGHHASSVSACKALVTSNRERIEEQIAALLK
jgi:hypothetical protein